MHIKDRRRGEEGQCERKPSVGARPLRAERLIIVNLTLKLVGFCAIGAAVALELQALYIGLLVAGLYGAAIVLAFRLLRELRGRVAAEQQLMLLASTDSLTGLANRRRFDETMECEWTHAIRDGTTLALLMIDADWFKLYNDANGHQAGDCLLQAISRCIATGTRRASDFAARYGGEEFAVLLPGLDAKTAFNVAERIRAKVVNLGLKHRASPFGIATVSIGVSCFAPTAGSDARDLITAADRALYQAKRLGRHRTEPAQPAGELTSTATSQPPAPKLRLVS